MRWPDWKDSGSRVRVMKDNDERVGILFANDVGNDGENEWPIFDVQFEDGSVVPFTTFDAWEILP